MGDYNNEQKSFMVNGKPKAIEKPREKQFIVRNSPLTDLFDNVQVSYIYNAFIASFFILLCQIAIKDYMKVGRLVTGIRLIKLAFGNFHLTIVGWLILFATTCSGYGLFNIWARRRRFKSKYTQTWDRFWLLVLIVSYLLHFTLAFYIIIEFKLPVASASIIAMEQTRFLMKLHAFIRTTASKVLHKPTLDTNLPSLRHFIYFLFAPTLLFKDHYPRTAKIRWSYVLLRFCEVLTIILYYSFLIDAAINPSVEDFGIRKYALSEILVAIFRNSISGFVILMATFFLILHVWQNMFAELTMFGDRLFYKDWWRSTDLNSYFRTWNVLVHDWLFVYVFRDVAFLVGPKYVIVAKLAVFVVSAAVHEWIVSLMLGFFFPVLFSLFIGFGLTLSFVSAPKIDASNVFLWYALAVGMGIVFTIYSLEFYVRLNVPVQNASVMDFMVPKMFTCDWIDYQN